MKKIAIYFIAALLISLISNFTYCQTLQGYNKIKELAGHYNSGKGMQLFISTDNSFCILKTHNKAFDAAIPGCDTIAKGMYQYYMQSAIKLTNNRSFKSVNFEVLEEKRFSPDSIYLKVNLPKDNAFFEGRFKFQYAIVGKTDFLETISPLLVVSKKNVFESGNLNYHIGLTIQDLSPLNCKLNGTCYQKIYFKIFEDIKLNSKSNFFTIKLPDFNDCYVEQADVNEQLMFVDNNKIHWQDIEFIKVK